MTLGVLSNIEENSFGLNGRCWALWRPKDTSVSWYSAGGVASSRNDDCRDATWSKNFSLRHIAVKCVLLERHYWWGHIRLCAMWVA